MTNKQIIIDYENFCKNYSKEVGCYNTFDGSCIKEQCFTYRLLQLLKAKEQECEKLKEKIKYMEEYIKTVENSRNEFDKESKINGKIEYDIKSDMIAQEEKKKIKRSECPYGGIDCAWCLEDCE